MAVPVPELEERALACAERLAAADRVLLASHIDADGLTSAGIAATALERAEIPFESVFEKQLDDKAIAAIAAREEETVLFTDFGSGQLEAIGEHADEFTPVIADHHRPAETGFEPDHHMNPLLVGIDGAAELSGAGTTYVLARALESVAGSEADNRDLAALAVVGAVGDMQASGGELEGANAEIVKQGVEVGAVETSTDLALYGKQTRPLPKLLEYATDVRIPGISNDAGGSLRFLESLDVDLRTAEGSWRCWSELADDEKQSVASGLVRRAVSKGVPAEKIEGLVATSYVLAGEPVGSELRDASEFSTLLNATARYARADVGLGVCLGDREGALDRARTLLREHRRNLAEGIEWVTEEGVTREEHVQWFHAEDRIRETIVGIVAGMAMGSEGVSRSLPIVAFAEKEGEAGEIKVSTRGTGRLVSRGLDLSTAIGEAARAVGGDGGGHDVAAGATIPAGRESAFLDRLDTAVGEQLS
ncbi:single-stranded-DNA-specific exonuclease RecJ [Saliphagus infecundisoli]|uniref:DHH family phosphoesterase n=1 Tax=Saliphagus infecundisoli TaxID=1849069 RepID=A0ABD5QKF1_9EURY|nr:DHH family phosphoesterase [Saliphagus infecundisoli]